MIEFITNSIHISKKIDYIMSAMVISHFTGLIVHKYFKQNSSLILNCNELLHYIYVNRILSMNVATLQKNTKPA